MPRTTTFRSYCTGLAVLAAAALSGCQGNLEMTDAASPSLRAEPAKDARGARDAAEDSGRPAQDREEDRAEDPGRDGEERNADRAEADASASAQLYVVRSESSDLEFSEGLVEPPQQQVLPAPAPWTPAPGADGAAQPVIDDVWPGKAPSSGGEKIVIRGKNLAAAQVVFGLAPARILSVSDSQDTLTVAAPAADAGEVGIVVTNRDGSYALSSGTFQYYN